MKNYIKRSFCLALVFLLVLSFAQQALAFSYEYKGKRSGSVTLRAKGDYVSLTAGEEYQYKSTFTASNGKKYTTTVKILTDVDGLRFYPESLDVYIASVRQLNLSQLATNKEYKHKAKDTLTLIVSKKKYVSSAANSTVLIKEKPKDLLEKYTTNSTSSTGIGGMTSWGSKAGGVILMCMGGETSNWNKKSKMLFDDWQIPESTYALSITGSEWVQHVVAHELLHYGTGFPEGLVRMIGIELLFREALIVFDISSSSSTGKPAANGAEAAIKDVKIGADYNGDGKSDFTYTITGVLETSKIQIAKASQMKDKADSSLTAVAGKKMDVYTVKVGQKIMLAGSVDCYLTPMQYKNNQLVDLYSPEDIAKVDWSKVIVLNRIKAKEVKLGSGRSYTPFADGAYAQFLEEGYYLFAVLPFVPQHYETNVKKENFGECFEEPTYKYNGIVLHVVK